MLPFKRTDRVRLKPGVRYGVPDRSGKTGTVLLTWPDMDANTRVDVIFDGEAEVVFGLAATSLELAT